VVSLIRLLVFPAIFLVLGEVFGFAGSTRFLCALCTLAMPLGLSTIVVPAAYGRDTSQAAGMALISHALSCITIPIIFFFVQ
jgi:predicted permease